MLSGEKIKCKIQFKGERKDAESQEGDVFKLIRFTITDQLGQSRLAYDKFESELAKRFSFNADELNKKQIQVKVQAPRVQGVDLITDQASLDAVLGVLLYDLEAGKTLKGEIVLSDKLP